MGVEDQEPGQGGNSLGVHCARSREVGATTWGGGGPKLLVSKSTKKAREEVRGSTQLADQEHRGLKELDHSPTGNGEESWWVPQTPLELRDC